MDVLELEQESILAINQRIAELVASEQREQAFIEKLQEQITLKQDELKKLEEIVGRFESEKAKNLEEWQAQQNAQQSILDEINGDIAHYKKELNELIEKSDSLADEIKQKESELESLKSNTSLFQTQLESLQAQKKGLEENLESIYSTTEVASKREKDLLEEVNVLKHTREILLADIGKAGTGFALQKENNEKTLSELKNEITVTQTQLDELQVSYGELHKKTEELKVEHSNLLSEYSTKKEELEKRGEIISLAEQRLQTKITNFEAKIKQAQADKLIADNFMP